MITSLMVENFQIHKKTQLEFDPGINAIVGSSRQGKSSIMRALIWLLRNKPTGDHFINWDADSTRVVAHFEPGGRIERYRSTNSNWYKIGNDNPLKALRGGVPDEVIDVTQIGDDHIQHQLFNNIFLLNNTPGEVSAKLNEVGGLNDIDETLSNINGIQKTAAQEKDRQKQRINEINTKLQEYAELDEIDKQVTHLENESEEIEGIELSIEFINNELTKVDRKHKEIQDIKQFLFCEELVNEIHPLADEIEDMQKRINQLERSLRNIDDKNDELEAYESFLKLEKPAKSILDTANEVEKEDQQVQRLNSMIEKLSKAMSQKQRIDQQIEQHRNELNELTDKIGVCPICNKPFNKE